MVKNKKTSKKTNTRKTAKKPKGYDKAARNAIPLGDILSGKVSAGKGFGGLGGMMGMGALGGLGNMNLGKQMGGPGSHIPVQESGASIGTMADGKKIWLKGSLKGQLVK